MVSPTSRAVLAGRSAVVTGASSGVGHAVAESMAAAGAAVAINYHSHAEEAETLAAKIRDGGGKALAIEADVSQEADVAALFQQTMQAFGRVDISSPIPACRRTPPSPT